MLFLEFADDAEVVGNNGTSFSPQGSELMSASICRSASLAAAAAFEASASFSSSARRDSLTNSAFL
jgi:hypothetical protein